MKKKKYVCERSCQIRIDGRVHMITPNSPNAVQTLDKPHPCFRELDKIDFGTAGEAELHEGDYELADLKKYLAEAFDVKVGNMGRDKCIEKLLDCRFRSFSTPEDMVRENKALKGRIDELEAENKELRVEAEVDGLT